MNLIGKWKLRKIKKLKERPGSENALKKYLEDDKWLVNLAAIEAFEFIGTESATEKLIKHFSTLKSYHTSDAKRIIEALGKIDSRKSIEFVKKIYLENNYSDLPFNSECAKFAKRILNKKGSPEVIIDQIIDLNEKKLTNKNISNKEVKTLSNKVKKYVHREKHLSQILANIIIPEIAEEVFKKMDNQNIDVNPYLSYVVARLGISKKLLDRWTDKELFIKKFNGYIIHKKEDVETRILISKVDDFGYKYKKVTTIETCRYCEGTGKYKEVEKLSELDVAMGINPKLTTHNCNNCKGTGKNSMIKLQIIL